MNQDSIIVKCTQCGAKNRIPKSRVGDRAVCGKCRTPLSLSARYPDHMVDVNDRNFASEVLDFPGAAAVYFWAPWCGYCKTFTPMMHFLASKYSGRIKFTKLAMDQNPITTSRYAVQSVPTLLLFKEGQEINRASGTIPQSEVERYLQAVL